MGGPAGWVEAGGPAAWVKASLTQPCRQREEPSTRSPALPVDACGASSLDPRQFARARRGSAPAPPVPQLLAQGPDATTAAGVRNPTREPNAGSGPGPPGIREV